MLAMLFEREMKQSISQNNCLVRWPGGSAEAYAAYQLYLTIAVLLSVSGW